MNEALTYVSQLPLDVTTHIAAAIAAGAMLGAIVSLTNMGGAR